MGMKISGASIAVYFDSSPSMNPYFAAVEKQIKEQFPAPTSIAISASSTSSRTAKSSAPGRTRTRRADRRPDLHGPPRRKTRIRPRRNQARLSPAGRNMFGSKDALFRIGGVGAWIEAMLNQKQYDAIVVFSDFDGVIQWRTIGEIKPNIVFDADMRPPTDLRTEAEKAWEARWIRTFAQAQDRKAPRLYLSTRPPRNRRKSTGAARRPRRFARS
jgi:hypothetical protein